jgi:hypothetical protein
VIFSAEALVFNPVPLDQMKCVSEKSYSAQIDTFGINEFTLFPGLDGLSKYLEWKNN